jgi:hypothetical protein
MTTAGSGPTGPPPPPPPGPTGPPTNPPPGGPNPPLRSIPTTTTYVADFTQQEIDDAYRVWYHIYKGTLGGGAVKDAELQKMAFDKGLEELRAKKAAALAQAAVAAQQAATQATLSTVQQYQQHATAPPMPAHPPVH